VGKIQLARFVKKCTRTLFAFTQGDATKLMQLFHNGLWAAIILGKLKFPVYHYIGGCCITRILSQLLN
jgi:hypothetical protein